MTNLAETSKECSGTKSVALPMMMMMMMKKKKKKKKKKTASVV
jgi:hypothetical protein